MAVGLASVGELLNYDSALPEAGKESVLNGRAWTSPCSTLLISVGSVRELPQATKVELCLLNTATVFICGGAIVCCIRVRGVERFIQRALHLGRNRSEQYIQPLQLYRRKATSRNSVWNR